jgi:hypothetical protein
MFGAVWRSAEIRSRFGQRPLADATVLVARSNLSRLGVLRFLRQGEKFDLIAIDRKI